MTVQLSAKQRRKLSPLGVGACLVLGFCCIRVAVGVARYIVGGTAMEEHVNTTAGYVFAHQALDALKQSKCGYLANITFDSDAALREVTPYLTKDEADAVISSTTKGREDIVKALNDTLSKTLNGTDDAMACAKMLRAIDSQVAAANTKW